MKLNQFGRSLLTNSFFFKMVQMRRCFQATCTKPVHEEKNIQKMCRFKKESGRSMIEMLGVLAIIGVLSIGAIAGYSKAMEKHKLNKTIEEIDTIIQNAKTLCSGRSDICSTTLDTYAPDQTAILKKLAIIPDYMWQEDNSLKNSFGGKVVFAILPKGPDRTLGRTHVEYYNIPKSVCVGLLTTNFNDLDQIIVLTDEYDVSFISTRLSQFLNEPVDFITTEYTSDEVPLYKMGTLPITMHVANLVCGENTEIHFHFSEF